MKALILAAGQGTRLRPQTYTTPKPMLPIGGRPLLHHTLAWLRRHGVREATINLHHLGEVIAQGCGSGEQWDVRLRYLWEPTLLGSAGTLYALRSWFDGPLVVVYGDVLTDMDLDALLAFHRERGAAVTVGLHRASNPGECGIVALDRDFRITRFVEKPRSEEIFSDLASAGVLVFEPSVRTHLMPGPCDIGRHLLPLILGAQLPVFGWPLKRDEYLLDIGSPAAYQRAQSDVSAGRVKLPLLASVAREAGAVRAVGGRP